MTTMNELKILAERICELLYDPHLPQNFACYASVFDPLENESHYAEFIRVKRDMLSMVSKLSVTSVLISTDATAFFKLATWEDKETQRRFLSLESPKIKKFTKFVDIDKTFDIEQILPRADKVKAYNFKDVRHIIWQEVVASMKQSKPDFVIDFEQKRITFKYNLNEKYIQFKTDFMLHNVTVHEESDVKAFMKQPLKKLLDDHKKTLMFLSKIFI